MRLRSLVVFVVPLLILGGLACWMWQAADPLPETKSNAAPGNQTWIPMELSKAEAVDRIPGWDVRRGNYQLVEVEGRKVLEQSPEPIVEGKIVWTRAMRGGGGVRARMRGEKSRRAYPRFSVGLHQERELHLRAFPSDKKLQLVACNADLTNEVLLAEVPLPEWHWKPEEWLWLELQLVPDGDGTSICEGRIWTEGGVRPEKALLQHRLTLPPVVIFAALQGAPFALKPIFIDAAETLPANGR